MIARRDTAGPLRVAVPKGALFAECLEVFSRAGLDVAPLSDAGRRLVVGSGDVSFVIAKPSDIPVYVAYGAVDCAIAGADVLLEARLDIVELVDLGFGRCRFVVAELEDAADDVEEAYRRLGVIRVATKYPRITETHFAAKGVQVEIVGLGGNIEIAPLIGLADRIVDITATGTTLRENRLRVVEEVLESTARFVANPASLRLRSDEVATLARSLASAVPLE